MTCFSNRWFVNPTLHENTVYRIASLKVFLFNPLNSSFDHLHMQVIGSTLSVFCSLLSPICEVFSTESLWARSGTKIVSLSFLSYHRNLHFSASKIAATLEPSNYQQSNEQQSFDWRCLCGYCSIRLRRREEQHRRRTTLRIARRRV